MDVVVQGEFFAVSEDFFLGYIDFYDAQSFFCVAVGA